MLACGGCRRHVRERDPVCPFCASPIRTVVAPLAATIVTMVLACGPSVTDPSGDGAATSTAADDTDASDGNDGAEGADGLTDGSAATTGGPDPSGTTVGGSTDDGEDVDSDSGAGFIYGAPDDPGTFECDLLAQDCMRGEKCSSFNAPGAAGTLDSTACVPVAPDPDPLGAPCDYDPETGADSCDAGSFCMFSGPDGERRCEALCVGDEAAPECGETTSCVFIEGLVPVCLPACDPLEPVACADWQACIPANDAWICFDSLETPVGESCEYVNACEAGAICANAEVLPDCEGSGCCAPLCNLGEADPDAACADPTECVAFYGDDPPTGLEDLGVCAIP